MPMSGGNSKEGHFSTRINDGIFARIRSVRHFFALNFSWSLVRTGTKLIVVVKPAKFWDLCGAPFQNWLKFDIFSSDKELFTEGLFVLSNIVRESCLRNLPVFTLKAVHWINWTGLQSLDGFVESGFSWTDRWTQLFEVCWQQNVTSLLLAKPGAFNLKHCLNKNRSLLESTLGLHWLNRQPYQHDQQNEVAFVHWVCHNDESWSYGPQSLRAEDVRHHFPVSWVTGKPELLQLQPTTEGFSFAAKYKAETRDVVDSCAEFVSRINICVPSPKMFLVWAESTSFPMFTVHANRLFAEKKNNFVLHKI